MSSIRFSKFIVLALSVFFLSVATSAKSTQAQIINLDLSGIVIDPDEVNGLSQINALRYLEAVERGKEFWDARVLGYSNTLPKAIQNQLSGTLTIFISNAALPPNVLGQAGLDQMTLVDIVRGNALRNEFIAVGQVAIFTLDNDFIANNTTDEITDVAIHEFGHALGIGSLWIDNGLIQQVGNGAFQYVGPEARRAFAIEAGVAGLAQTGFVPIEMQGGPGTAFSHWEDDNGTFNSIDVDNRIELMTGFLIPNTERFISNTSLASLVDMHYVVRGFNEDELLQFPQTGARNIPGLGLTRLQGPAGFAAASLRAKELQSVRKDAINLQQRLRLYKKSRR